MAVGPCDKLMNMLDSPYYQEITIPSPRFLFRCYLVFYAEDEKETTVKETSTDVVLLAICFSFLCIGNPEIDS